MLVSLAYAFCYAHSNESSVHFLKNWKASLQNLETDNILKQMNSDSKVLAHLFIYLFTAPYGDSGHSGQ